ncbi:hypothetical protein AAC387_Pa07g1583 [Persea americana]
MWRARGTGANEGRPFFRLPSRKQIERGEKPQIVGSLQGLAPSIAGILISSLDPSPQLTSRDATTNDCPSPNSLFLFTMSRSRHGLPPLPNPFSALPSVEPPLPNPPL